MTSSWDSIFLDTHFEPAGWVLPLGPVQQNANNNINLAPLQFVTDVEPIGHTYHKLVFPDQPGYVVPALQDDEIDPQELIDAVREADLGDYYALLYVSDKGINVAEADIQKTWKIINLYLHPDKAESARKEQAEVLFKACHKAFETLTNPKLKLDYDSQIPFDDSIPSEKATYKTTDQFIQAFAPVFERNERWSKTQPCPKLGNANASEDDLNKFYKFWLSFQSWREFPQGDTEKVGDSAGRQERRDAENKNAKARALLKQKETARIRSLAERAQAADPRLKVLKLAKAELEKIAKQASYDAKQLAVQQKLNKQEQEKAAKAAYDRVMAGGVAEMEATAAAAAVAAAVGAATSTASSTAPKSSNIVATGTTRGEETPEQRRIRLEEEFMAMVKQKLAGALAHDKFYYVENPQKKTQIPIIVDRLLGHNDYAKTKALDDILLQHGYNDTKGINGRRILEMEAVSAVWDELEGHIVEKKADTGPREWTKTEEEALHRAMVKWALGTKDRYLKVTEQVNLVNAKDAKRTEKEIIKKVKLDELIRQAGGLEEYNKLNALRLAQQQQQQQQQPPVAPEPTQTPAAPTVDSDVTSWTPDEQKLLEKGLQSVPKDASDRWELISGMVGSRSAAQCAERFKYLRDQIAAKKAAAAAAAAGK